MAAFAALDVSKKSTSIHIVDEKGVCLWRGKTLTDPDALAEALSPFSDDLALVGLETGSWTTWLWHELTERGFPMVCMDARQAHAAWEVVSSGAEVTQSLLDEIRQIMDGAP